MKLKKKTHTWFVCMVHCIYDIYSYICNKWKNKDVQKLFPSPQSTSEPPNPEQDQSELVLRASYHWNVPLQNQLWLVCAIKIFNALLIHLSLCHLKLLISLIHALLTSILVHSFIFSRPLFFLYNLVSPQPSRQLAHSLFSSLFPFLSCPQLIAWKKRKSWFSQKY